MGLQSRILVVGCLVVGAIGCDAHSSAKSHPTGSPSPRASAQPNINGLRELARVPVTSTHHPYDVVSDGRALVWDQGDDAASEKFGGRVLMWQSLGATRTNTVATTTGAQLINDAVVFGNEVFYRIITHEKHGCPGDPRSCFSWSLWRRTMPDGAASRLGRGAPIDQTLLPNLVTVGKLGVAYQQPAGHHREAIMFVPLSGPPRSIAPDAVPGSLSADDSHVYVQLPAAKHCCVELRIDPRRPDQGATRTFVSEPATKIYGAFGSSRAALVLKADRLVLHVTAGTASTTQVMASDVYDMFWLDADHLLLYRADGLLIYSPTTRDVAKLVGPDDVDIGAAVHTEASVLTYASPAGKPSVINLWRIAS